MKRSTTRQEKPKQRFKVGSRAFFSDYADFESPDSDEVEFEENPKLYRFFMQFRKKDGSKCLFKWRRMSADDFVEYSLNKSNLPMEIGKFLVPEIADYLGFTIEHLRKLSPVVDRLDEKHRYEKVIYDAYLENGAFYLTDAQRRKAYYEYARNRGITIPYCGI